MGTYVFRDGQLVDKATGEPMVKDVRAPIGLPMLMGFKAYACPITGKEIRTLEQHKANLKKHNCIEAAELPSPTGGKIRNRKWAEKRGFKVSEQYREEPWRPKGLK